MSGKRVGTLTLEGDTVALHLDGTVGIPWEVTWGDIKPVKDKGGWLCRVWFVTINGHTFPYYTGTENGVGKHNTPGPMGRAVGRVLDRYGYPVELPNRGRWVFAPDVRDALGSLFSDASCVDGYSLDDFASDFGITVPSKAVAMFQACHDSNAALSRILGSEREAYRAALEDGGHI